MTSSIRDKALVTARKIGKRAVRAREAAMIFTLSRSLPYLGGMYM